jgi:AcrR family transcriptional regulator
MRIMIRKQATENRIKKERERRIDDILVAARGVILMKSYSSATMDDIAAEAGISKPTIYQYFKTKEDLFVQMIEPMVRSLAQNMEKIRISLEKKEYSTGRDIVKDAFKIYFETFEKNPEIIKIFNMFLQIGRLNQLNKEASEEIKALGKKSYVEGNLVYKYSIEQGFFHDTDTLHATDLVWGTFCGIVQIEQNRWNKEGLSIYLKPAIDYAENFFISSIVKR